MGARRIIGLGLAAGLILMTGLGQVFGAEAEPQEAEPLAGSVPSSAPQVPALLTLDDALTLALQLSPELTGSSLGVGTAEGLELQARKTPNPEIEFRFTRLGEQGGQEDVARRRVVLQQDIELGGKRRRRVNLARIESELAKWDERSQRDRVTAIVSMEFAEVLGAQRRVERYREFVEYIEKLNKAAELMVETGSLRRTDLQLIARRRGLARIDLREAEADLDSARYALAATWGSPSPVFETVVGELETAGPIASIEAVLQMAKGSPSAARWETEVERSRAELSLSRAGAVPDLGVGVAAASDEASVGNDYFLEFEIGIPLFDRNQGKIRAARSEILRAEAGREAAVAADSRRIAELYFELGVSEARSTILEEEVIPAVRATVEAFRVGFEGQTEDLVDVLDSRRDLAKAETQRIDALVDYRQTLAELEYIVGRSITLSD